MSFRLFSNSNRTYFYFSLDNLRMRNIAKISGTSMEYSK